MKTILATLIILSFAIQAQAKGDIARGKKKSVTCSACHGANGISAAPIWPNLAGQKAAYIEAQLKAFKTGVRKNASMMPMVKPLTPQDMKDLAAYYSSLSCAK